MSPPDQVGMVFSQVDAATKQLSGDGTDLGQKWTADLQRVGYGDNAYDVLVAALQSYYFKLEAGIFPVANPLPGQFTDAAAAGRTALQTYLDGQTGAVSQFHR